MALLLYIFFLNAWLLSFSVHGGDPTKPTPELSFRPKPVAPGFSEASLLWYKVRDQGNITALTRELDRFLSYGYKVPGLISGRGQNVVTCDYHHPPQEGKVCDVDVRNLAPCTSEHQYGYHTGSPCIFITLDKMFGWQAEFYNQTENLPNDMPDDLKDNIRALKMTDVKYANQVWLNCKGENPVDVENIGPIQYYPGRGFPGYYFPFEDVEGNLSPLVAIRFERPIRGIVISVECKIYARNIKYSVAEKRGIIRFELLVD